MGTGGRWHTQSHTGRTWHGQALAVAGGNPDCSRLPCSLKNRLERGKEGTEGRAEHPPSSWAEVVKGQKLKLLLPHAHPRSPGA